MYEKLLAEAEKFLEEQKTKEVPILEMWDCMLERSGELNFEMPETIGDFECLIEADKRFLFVAIKTEEEIDDVDVGEEEGEYEVGEDFFAVEEIEKLGFNQNQVVGLKKYEKKKNDDDEDDDLPVRSKARTKTGTVPALTQPKKSAKTKKSVPPKKKKK